MWQNWESRGSCNLSHRGKTATGTSFERSRPAPRILQDQEAPEVIDGIRVKRSGKRGKGGPSAAPRLQLEKPVVNCLACGKVYDCRLVTNDIINFLGARQHQQCSNDASEPWLSPG